MIAPTFTPKQLKTQLENLIGDTFDVTHTYQLLTQAKNLVETNLKLAILRSYDGSQTASPGDTYLTLKTLPTDFKSVNKILIGPSGIKPIEYFPIPFFKRELMQKISRRYYIDYKRAVQGSTALGLTGSVPVTSVIHIHYQVATADLTESNENTAGIVLWPDEFQPLIPYQVAKIIQGNTDADEINFRMSVEQEREYQRLLDGLVAWDADIKLAEMGGQLGYADEYNDADQAFDIGSL